MYDLEGQRLRIVFGDDKVFISEKRGESTAKWSAFVRLSEEKSHAFLWTNKRQAIVVPFDSFMSLGQRDAFLILARSKIGISA